MKSTYQLLGYYTAIKCDTRKDKDYKMFKGAIFSMENVNKRDISSSKRGYELVNFCEFDKYAAQSYCAIHEVDPKLNLGDITKVDETKLKPFNMICGGSPCFVAGTKILTQKGYVNIEDIIVGDLVYTKEGRWKKVLRIGSDGEKETFTLKAMGVLSITCTSNHPFWIRSKHKKWNNDIRQYEFYLDKPQKIQLKDIQLNESFIGVPIIKDCKSVVWNYDDEILWLIGRYIADGHIGKNELILSIGKDKLDDFENHVSIPHRTHEHTSSCYREVFNRSSIFYSIIANGDFGNSALNKNIPIEYLELPKDKLKVLLDGYMSGDGCSIRYKKCIKQATTISRRLAESLVLAVQKVYGVGCKIYYTERPKHYVIEGRVVNQHNTYQIRFLTETYKKSYYQDDNFFWYPVKKIYPTKKTEKIYNIEVEEDHTYIANNIAVFNCQDFSLAGKQKGSVWKCNDCGEEYNPLTVHYSERHKCPKCGSENLDKSRSSLLVEWLRVIRFNKPSWGIYENVKNIVGSKFKETFQMFIDELNEYGYNTHYKVLNAKDYGIPQNRERVYLIIIKKELDNGKFKFPEPFDNGLRLRDMLEDEVDEKYYINTQKANDLIDNLKQSGKLDKEVSNAVRGGGAEEA